MQASGRSLHSSRGGTCWPGAEPTGRGPSCRSEPHRVPHRPHPGHGGCPSTGAPPLGSKATDARHAGATEGRRGQGKGWGDGPPGPSSGFSPSSPSAGCLLDGPLSRFPLCAGASLSPHLAPSRASGPAWPWLLKWPLEFPSFREWRLKMLLAVLCFVRR